MDRIDTYSCGVLWGPRLQSLECCAQSATDWLTILGELDPLFSNWSTGGLSYLQAVRQPVDISFKNIERIMRQTDPPFHKDRGESRDEGFRASLWNGRKGDEGLGVSTFCGSRFGRNNAIIGLPSVDMDIGPSPVAIRMLCTGFLIKLFKASISTWDPDFGRVFSFEGFEKTGVQGTGIEAGWLTYISPSIGAIDKLPKGVQAISLENGGQLLIVTEERFTAANPDHITAVRELTAACRELVATVGYRFSTY